MNSCVMMTIQGRMILHLSPGLSSCRTVVVWPHDFTLVSHLSPTVSNPLRHDQHLPPTYLLCLQYAACSGHAILHFSSRPNTLRVP